MSESTEPGGIEIPFASLPENAYIKGPRYFVQLGQPLEIPEDKIAKYEKQYTKAATPDWDRFRGNNHEHVDTGGWSSGGSVSFAEHLGKPLTSLLWIDLTMRLRLTRLRIYSPGNDGEWSDGCEGMARIYLDANGKVRDIRFAL